MNYYYLYYYYYYYIIFFLVFHDFCVLLEICFMWQFLQLCQSICWGVDTRRREGAINLNFGCLQSLHLMIKYLSLKYYLIGGIQILRCIMWPSCPWWLYEGKAKNRHPELFEVTNKGLSCRFIKCGRHQIAFSEWVWLSPFKLIFVIL